MRKASILILICCILFAGCRYDIQSDPGIDSRNGLRWIKDESYFVDYSIDGDKIVFRYALTFDNSAERDILVSYPSVSFYMIQTIGWIEYERFYDGRLEDGSEEFIIHAGERLCLIFSFEGKYVGGEVNENLGPPKTVMFMQDIVDNNSTD